MSELLSSLPTLCCGYDFTIFLDVYSNIWSLGDNYSGKCGRDITEKIIYYPSIINNFNNIQYISCGFYHTLCCDYNGNVFSFGENIYGQLGLNKSNRELGYSYIPQQITLLPHIKQISCGLYFSVCLSINNELWSFGQNHYGQLGVGNKINSTKPLKINNLSNIDYIQCGGNFTFCKTITNQCYSWGQNNYGQLAQGRTNEFTIIPHQCTTNIPENILSIRAGSYHVLFLTLNGIVYSCGNNTSKQLGRNDNKTKVSILQEISSLPFIKKIACGYSHSLCIDIDNNLWVFGSNYKAQLGLGHTNCVNKPIKHETIKNIIDISHGGDSTFIKTLDNKIYVFGDNNKAKLGVQIIYKLKKEPTQILKDKEDIWKTNIHNNRAKSARK